MATMKRVVKANLCPSHKELLSNNPYSHFDQVGALLSLAYDNQKGEHVKNNQ